MAAKPGRKTAHPVAKAKSSPRSVAPAEATVLASLASMGSVAAAASANQFFKTGIGQDVEGDQFLCIKMPVLRAFVRDLKGAGIEVALPLLRSSLHEARAAGLMLLVRIFQRGDEKTRKRIFGVYLKSTKFIDNWDLVDILAEHTVGGWLSDKPSARNLVLTRLAKSKSLWERRGAILATSLHQERRRCRDVAHREAAIEG